MIVVCLISRYRWLPQLPSRSLNHRKKFCCFNNQRCHRLIVALLLLKTRRYCLLSQLAPSPKQLLSIQPSACCAIQLSYQCYHKTLQSPPVAWYRISFFSFLLLAVFLQQSPRSCQSPTLVLILWQSCVHIPDQQRSKCKLKVLATIHYHCCSALCRFPSTSLWLNPVDLRQRASVGFLDFILSFIENRHLCCWIFDLWLLRTRKEKKIWSTGSMLRKMRM